MVDVPSLTRTCRGGKRKVDQRSLAFFGASAWSCTGGTGATKGTSMSTNVIEHVLAMDRDGRPPDVSFTTILHLSSTIDK